MQLKCKTKIHKSFSTRLNWHMVFLWKDLIRSKERQSLISPKNVLSFLNSIWKVEEKEKVLLSLYLIYNKIFGKFFLALIICFLVYF